MASVDIKSPETIARAALEKLPATGLTPQQELAKKISDEATKKGPRSSLEAMRTPDVPDKTKVEHYLDRNFYSKVKDDGTTERETGSRAEIRFNNAKKFEAAGRKFLEHGWDPAKFNADEQKFIKDSIKSVIESWPDGKSLMDSLPPTTRTADIDKIISELLKNPDMKPNVQKIFGGVFDDAKVREQITHDVQSRLEKQRDRQKKKQEEIDKNSASRGTNTTELSEYDASKAKGMALAKLDAEASDAQSQKVTAERVIDRNNRQIERLEERIDMMDPITHATEIDTYEKRIAKLKDENDKAEIKAKEANDKLIRRQELLQEKQQLQEERRRLSEEHARLEKEKDDIDDAVNRANVEFALQQSKHEKSEEQIVDELQGVFSEATRQYLEKKITVLEEARQKVIDKEIEDAKKANSPEEKGVLEALNSRWDRDISNRNAVRKWWNPANREFNRGQISQDYNSLITGGPDSVLYNMIRRTDPTGTKFPDDAAIDTWIAANSETADRMRVKVVETLLSKRIQTGKITEGDARFIAGSSWGKEAINKALKDREDVKQAIEKLRKDKIFKGNAGEWLNEQIRGNPLFWIMLILGGAAVGAITPALFGAGVAGLTTGGISALSAPGAMLGAAVEGGALASYKIANENLT